MSLMPCVVFLFEPVQVSRVGLPALAGDAELSWPGTAPAVFAAAREQASPLLDAQRHCLTHTADRNNRRDVM